MFFYSSLFFPVFAFIRILFLSAYKKADNYNTLALSSDIILLIVHGGFLLIFFNYECDFPYSLLTIWFWFILCTVSYIIVIYKKERLSPKIELGLNIVLIIGFIINIMTCINEPLIGVFGSLWFALFYLIAFIKNQESIIEKFKNKYL